MRSRQGIPRSLVVFAFLVYLIVVAALVWWHFASPQRAVEAYQREQKSLVQEIVQADIGEITWANVETIEEAWPEVVVAQEVPYYYAQLQRAADLHDKVEYSDHKARLKPYAKLTRNERLLLARRVPSLQRQGSFLYVGPSEDLSILRLLSLVAVDHWKSAFGGTKMWQDMLVSQVLNHCTLPIVAERDSTAEKLSIWVGSPINHSALIPFSEELSPGNAYCEMVELSMSLHKIDSAFADYYYPFEENRYYYMYYRVYGEHDVIAEGIWGWPRGY